MFETKTELIFNNNLPIRQFVNLIMLKTECVIAKENIFLIAD